MNSEHLRRGHLTRGISRLSEGARMTLLGTEIPPPPKLYLKLTSRIGIYYAMQETEECFHFSWNSCQKDRTHGRGFEKHDVMKALLDPDPEP